MAEAAGSEHAGLRLVTGLMRSYLLGKGFSKGKGFLYRNVVLAPAGPRFRCEWSHRVPSFTPGTATRG